MSALKKIADCFGPGPKMMFAMDTESKKGKLIIHFVQFHTLCVDDDGHFDKAVLLTVHDDNDPRLKQFAKQIHET